jgi:hypothetical protein
MGAYDNPRILPPPNYAEIYQRSFLSAQAGVNQAFAGFRAKKKQKGIDIKKAEDQFDKQQEVIATLPRELQDQADMLNDQWFENEMKNIDGNIDRSDYRANKIKIRGTMLTMAQDGKEINTLNEEVKGSKLSRYQNKGYLYTLGLANAWEDKAIKIDYQNGNRIIKWKDLDGNEQILDAKDKTIKEALGFNNVYDFDNKKLQDLGQSVSNMGIEMLQIKSSTDGVDTTIDAKIYTDAKQYLPDNYDQLDGAGRKEAVELANAKHRNNMVKGLTGEFGEFFTNEDDSGSLFLDNSYEALVNINLNDPTKSTLKSNAAGLISKALDGMDLTDDQKNTISENLRLGVYNIDEKNDPDGKIKMGMDSISRHVLAEQSYDAATKKDGAMLKESTVILSPDEIESRSNKLIQQRLTIQKSRESLDDSEESDEPIIGLNDYIKNNYNLTGGVNPSNVSAVINNFRNPVKLVNGQEATLFNEDGSFKNTADLYTTLRDVENKSFFNLPDGSFNNVRSVKEIASIIPAISKIKNKEELTNDEKTLLKNFGFSDVVINSRAGVNANITNVLKWANSLDFNDPKTINGYIEIAPGSLKDGKKETQGRIKNTVPQLNSNWKFVNSSEKNTTDLIKNNFQDRFAGIDPSVIARLVRDLQNSDSGLMKLLNN